MLFVRSPDSNQGGTSHDLFHGLFLLLKTTLLSPDQSIDLCNFTGRAFFRTLMFSSSTATENAMAK